MLKKRTVVTLCATYTVYVANIHLHTLPHSLCSFAMAPFMLIVVVEVSK